MKNKNLRLEIEKIREFIEKFEKNIDIMQEQEEQLSIEKTRQEGFTKDILDGKTEVISQKTHYLYCLPYLPEWVIDDIKQVTCYLDKNVDLKEKYAEEYSELQLLSHICNALLSNPDKVPTQLYNEIFQLKSHSKGNMRLFSIMHFYFPWKKIVMRSMTFIMNL